MTPTIAPQGLDIPDFVMQPLPKEEIARRQEIAARWAAYRGNFPAPLVSPDGKSALPENVITNRCRPIVDKGKSFLFGQIVKIQLPKGTQEQQSCLDSTFGDDDKRMNFLGKMAINGAIAGTPFVRLFEPIDSDHFPRLINLDPMTVYVLTDEDDCECANAYIIEYDVSRGPNQTITKRQAIWRVDPDGQSYLNGGFDADSTWYILQLERQGQNGQFRVVGDLLQWPHPYPPIAHTQNLDNPNEFHGMPDLPSELIDLNKSLNFHQSNVSKILKLHGSPLKFIVGAEAEQVTVKSGPEDVPCLPEGADMKMLQMGGDLAASANFIEQIRADMDEQSRVPAVALGRQESLPKGNVSGVALRVLYTPLLEKTTEKQRNYGELLREVCRRILDLCGKAAYDPAMPVDLLWPNLLPADDLQEAQTAQIKAALGVDTSTLIGEMGYDAEQELQKAAKLSATKQKLGIGGTPNGGQAIQGNTAGSPVNSQQEQTTPNEAGSASAQTNAAPNAKAG